ncbi:MAG TPA: hypothetical protein VJA21_29915 [Verrucomicrobiae bacterium]
MANSLLAWRAQLVFALCLPLAVLLGYMLADPNDFISVLVITGIIGLLSVPILMHSYHLLLIISWNAAIAPYFLPGQPFLWMLLSFVGFGFAIVNRFTSPEASFVPVPSVTRPVVALLAIVLVTAFLRGGIGFRVFGSGQYGGRGYFYILAAILGYFALISQRIPKNRVHLVVALFFLTGLTSFVPNLAYLAGRRLDFLYYVFPLSYALEQAVGDYSVTAQYTRILGLTYGSVALYCWLLARYGLRGIFNLAKPLRLVLFIAATVGCFYCGFRSFMVLFILVVGVQFFVEKLYQPRVLLVLGLGGALIGAAALPNLDRLPLVVQRSIAFMPLPLSPVISVSATESSRWRLEMWRDVWEDMENHQYEYLWKGKGYSIDPNELALSLYSSERGLGTKYAWAMVSGAYHNGPLTVLIPFGVWGAGAFVWFVIASIKYLYRNYRYGDPDLKTINTFLLAYFIARVVYYTGVFGSFFTDLFVFTGIIALSISINGAELPVAEEAEEPATRPVDEEGLAGAGAQ